MSLDIDLILGVVVVISSILISMTLHEATHAYVSNHLGDDTARLSGRLSINPLKHIDPLTTVLMPVVLYLLIGIPFGAAKPVPFNPSRLKYDEFGAALVGVSGPITNFVLAVLSGFWLRFIIGFNAGFLTDSIFMFMLVNLGFFVFNMIPFPPLDGSRLLYALAPDGVREFMRSIEMGGIASVGIFIFVFYAFLSPLIGSIIEYLSSLILGLNVFI